MDRHSLLRAAISTGAAGIARVYRLVRVGDGRRGALRVEIHIAPDGSGAWHAWTSLAWPSDGIQYDMRGTIEAQTPQERSDALAAQLAELADDLQRKPANRIYARSKQYGNSEAAAAIKVIKGALDYDRVQDDGGAEGQQQAAAREDAGRTSMHTVRHTGREDSGGQEALQRVRCEKGGVRVHEEAGPDRSAPGVPAKMA